MILTPLIVLRIALVLVVAVILQAAFFSQLSILGAPPDILPAVVVAFGLLGGAVAGAGVGFAAGLLNDSLLLQTLGISSLALLAAGYLAGRWREGFDITSSLVPPLLAGVLTMVAASTFAAITLMLGIDAPVSLLAIREILVQGLLAVALGTAVFPLVRRAIRPALVEDVRPGRRSAPQTMRSRPTIKTPEVTG